MNAYEILIQECDAEIRSGRLPTAAKRLSKINPSKVPREYRLRLAALARRAGIVQLGLTLLARVIYPPQRRAAAGREATPNERAEYAVLLQRTGAYNEAIAILKSIDRSKVPEANLYLAFVHFSRFEFQEAISPLERYLESPLEPYPKLVGQVNLAMALVSSGWHKAALELLEECITSSAAGGYKRLESNCRAMKARVRIHEGQFNEAQSELNEAAKIIGDVKTNDEMFILKWRAFLSGLKSRSVEPIREFRARAMNEEDFDGVRESDLYALKVKFNQSDFDYLYAGTPFQSYREEISRELVAGPSGPLFRLGSEGSRCLDLQTGEIDGILALSAGRKCHQLLEILLRDFYLPLKIGGLFSELFPDEHFDVFTSADRVHQLLRRTRQWVKEQALPVEIAENNGFYAVRIHGPCSFVVSVDRGPVDFMNLHFEKIKAAFRPGESFSAREAREKLGFPRTTFQRVLQWALENGKISKYGPANATVYSLIAADSSAPSRHSAA